MIICLLYYRDRIVKFLKRFIEIVGDIILSARIIASRQNMVLPDFFQRLVLLPVFTFTFLIFFSSPGLSSLYAYNFPPFCLFWQNHLFYCSTINEISVNFSTNQPPVILSC